MNGAQVEVEVVNQLSARSVVGKTPKNRMEELQVAILLPSSYIQLDSQKVHLKDGMFDNIYICHYMRDGTAK